jgi:uncharacterized protein (UPF0212 family)
MPYQKLKKTHPEYDPEYIQKKVDLIEKGLPIDITEDELETLETMLRGARSFYIDLLLVLDKQRKKGGKVDKAFIEEAKNLAGTELALRCIDLFRKKHQSKIAKSQKVKK